MKALFLPLLLALAACASAPGQKTAAPDAGAGEAAEVRAIKRWNHLLAAEFSQAYDYFSPGFRQTKPRQTYVAEFEGKPVRWVSAELGGVVCPEGTEYCDVTVNVGYELKSSQSAVGTIRATTPLVERWIGLDGVWYFVPKDIARR